MVPLSPGTLRQVEGLFDRDDAAEAVRLLAEECGDNLPFHESSDARGLERVRFAALKLSHGRLDWLRSAIRLAKTDWRDLLVAQTAEVEAREAA
ncbi:MAG: hypothetical protein ACXWLM_01500, partial [Myxococcales bacterium]